MSHLSTIQVIAISILPLILAITFHEAAHAYAAYKFGDNTAKMYGRLSLNPLHHIDPLGTIVLPLISITIGAMSGGIGFIFGWAKPVPINYAKLHNPKKDLMWVALAGPAANLVMAITWAIVFKFSYQMPPYFSTPIMYMAQIGIGINVSLFILNLLPILPLDGGRILASLLPEQYARKYVETERYGMIVLIVLMFSGILSLIISPLYTLLVTLILSTIS